MANLHLVTGYKGSDHVTSADQGSLNAAIFGAASCVLNRGNKFSASVQTNNSIRVLDGDLLIQGRHCRLNEGSYVDLTIENGAQGMKRNDLIVARYTKNSITGVEECNLVVIKGTAASGTASDPAYTEGNIITDHDATADFPLYRVPLDGINVQTLVPLFNVVNDMGSILGTGSIHTENLAEGAVTKYFTATIGTTWTGSEAPYTQDVTISGLLSTDKPIIDLLASTTWATAEAQLEAWANIFKIVAGANKITVYASEKTTTDIPIQLGVARR